MEAIMNRSEKEELYHRIDDDEEMSDREKRDQYRGEIEEQEDRERWENEQSGCPY